MEFPTELATNYIRDGKGYQVRYRKTGLIIHKGLSIAGGDYIAYLLIDRNWYEANNTRCRARWVDCDWTPKGETGGFGTYKKN